MLTAIPVMCADDQVITMTFLADHADEMAQTVAPEWCATIDETTTRKHATRGRNMAGSQKTVNRACSRRAVLAGESILELTQSILV